MLGQESEKLLFLRFLDIKRIGPWLSMATNVLTLGTASGVVAGFILVWRYLKGHDLGHEVMGILGTPHYLLVAAIIALAISVWLLAIVLLIPSILKGMSNPAYHRKGRRPISSWFIHFALCLCPGLLFALAVLFEPHGLSQLVWVTVLMMIQIGGLCAWYGGPPTEKMFDEPGKMGWVSYLMFLLMALLVLFMLLSYGLLLIGHQVYRILAADNVSLWPVGLGYGVYCLAITTTVLWREKIVSYLPAGIFAAVLLLLSLPNATNNIVSIIRIGHYEDTLMVSQSVVKALGEGHGFEVSRTNAKGIWQIENAWVIAALPNRIIVTPEHGEESQFSIPVGELRSKAQWLGEH